MGYQTPASGSYLQLGDNFAELCRKKIQIHFLCSLSRHKYLDRAEQKSCIGCL